MDKRELEDEFNKDAPLREPLEKLSAAAPPPQSHQDFILRAAQATAQTIRHRRPRLQGWQWPASLAASFLLGVLGTLTYTFQHSLADEPLSGLTIPVTSETRGESSSPSIPVEQAPADVWYRYIKELVYSGNAALAARHLQRFAQLHPDYTPEP